jgi:hypothetical protein
MEHQAWVAIATIILVGCAGSGGSEASSAIALDGIYLPDGHAGQGGTELIAFAHGADYLRVPASCDDDGCVETGTYVLDPIAKTLTLAEAKTGAKTTYAIEVLTTEHVEGASTARIQSDLVGGGGVVAPGAMSVVFHDVASDIKLVCPSSPGSTCADQALTSARETTKLVKENLDLLNREYCMKHTVAGWVQRNVGTVPGLSCN